MTLKCTMEIEVCLIVKQMVRFTPTENSGIKPKPLIISITRFWLKINPKPLGVIEPFSTKHNATHLKYFV